VLATATAALAAISVPVAHATPTTYDYIVTDEWISELDGLGARLAWPAGTAPILSISMTINGSFADLPVLNANQFLTTDTINFGDLLAFSFVLTGSGAGNMIDLTVPASFGGNQCGELGHVTCNGIGWSISPDGIVWGTEGGAYSLLFNTDPLSTLPSVKASEDIGGCLIGGICEFSGYWAAVPEPPSGTLFISGLFMLALFKHPGLRLARGKISFANRGPDHP
jgi:hypothetical protein